MIGNKEENIKIYRPPLNNDELEYIVGLIYWDLKDRINRYSDENVVPPRDRWIQSLLDRLDVME
jgi:hypothetical protein